MEKEKIEALSLACSKGEAVFYKQIGTIFQDPNDFQDYLAEIKEYLKKVGEYGDDRLFALVAQLLVENAVDSYLSEILTDYKSDLLDNRAFTFSLKIDIAMALRFSPKRYFEAADVIRLVRNEFAHNLEITTFQNLNPKIISKLNNTFAVCLPYSENSYKTSREKYSALTKITVTSLILYARHIRLLNAYLRDESFYTNISDFILNKKRKTPETP